MTLPKLSDHFPEFKTFVQEMAADFESGEIDDWAEVHSRVGAFFTPEVTVRMDALIPGWEEMARLHNGQTQTHTVCVLIALYNLPEFRAAAPVERVQCEWTALLHDIAKRPPPEGIREHFHAFGSAAQAAPILAGLGFPTEPAYPQVVEGWQAWVRTASISRDGVEFPDNARLPAILLGIDRMFGAESAAARILETILLHLSFSWIRDWPSAAPLSLDEIRAYIDPPLLDSLIVMALMDSDAWTLFDDVMRNQYRREILAFKREMIRIIIES